MTNRPENDDCDESDSESSCTMTSYEPSAVAQDVRNLRETILRLARDRERLPQPLFWSLFNARLKGIKDTKELQRLLASLEGTTE
jgi:hypothetical protein